MRAKFNDTPWFKKLMANSCRFLLRRGCPTIQDCEDVIQTVLMKLSTQTAPPNLDVPNFYGAWFRSLRNKNIDHFRRNRVFGNTITMDDGWFDELRLSNAESLPGPELAVEIRDLLDFIDENLAQRSERDQDIFRNFVTGWSLKELSDSYSIPYGTVNMIIRRFKQQLQDNMVDDPRFPPGTTISDFLPD